MTKILFVELLGGIGDVLLALPAIHALARTHAPARVMVLTFPPGGELLRADPYVQQVVHADSGARSAVAGVLERERFDLVVSDTCYDDIPALIRERGPARVVTNLWRDPPTDEPIDLRFLRLLVADGLVDPTLRTLPPRMFLTDDEVAQGRERLARAGQPVVLGRDHRPGALGRDGQPIVLLVPEAGMPIKQWPADRWPALTRSLVDQLGVTAAAVTGSDARLATEAVAGVGVVLPRLPLREVAAVAAAADVCVAADTGLARIAAAVGTRTLCLFGPTVAGRFGLRDEHRNISSPLPCDERNPRNMTEQSCWYSGRCVFDDRSSCMDDIGVPTVTQAVADLLQPET